MTTTPEQCHLCGHSHPVMAHWMGNGETRALCHEDDHSCYTRHNMVGDLRSRGIKVHEVTREWDQMDFSANPNATIDALGNVSVNIRPDISELVRALKRLGKAATRTQRAIKRLETTTNRRKPLIHKGKKP